MANEIGSTLLNSLTNSTFDVGNMAKVLAEADVAGPRSIVDKNKTKATTELDALTYLETNLKAFNSYVTELSSPKIFSEKQASSTNDSVVSIKTTGDAALGSYSIESKQLAQAHTLVSNKAYSSIYDTIAGTNLTINMGGVSHSITVDSTNNSLDGLQKYINNGDFGVTASVVNNGSGYQLMFTSKQQGAAGEVVLSGDTDLTTGGVTTTAAAQDAIMSINGLQVTNSSNTFDQVITGVSFQLNSVSLGQVNQVSVTQDPQKVIDAVKSFTDTYNQLDTIFKDLASYDTSKLTKEQLASDQYKYTGDLAGNSVLREVRSNIKSALSGAISELSGNYNALSVVGFKFALDGTLSVDETKLTDVATNNMSALSQLFSQGGSSTDSLVNVISGNENTQAGQYALNVTQLATRATVAGGAATIGTDQQVSSDKITDSTGALTIAAGASLDLTIGGTNQLVDLSTVAGAYATKDDAALAIQNQIATAFGSSLATVSYNVAQSRFEITANSGSGALSVNTSTNLDKQGFVTGQAYAGQGLIDLTGATDPTFTMKVDDSVSTTISIAQGRYTLESLASQLNATINNNADVKGSGNSVSVTATGGALNITSNRFGGYSNISMTGFSANFANAGFTADLTNTGQNVDGTITTASGTLNIGAYADAKDGRIIKISDYAYIGSTAAEVRGLQFQVLGGQLDGLGNLITDRGTMGYAKGFASRVEDTINGFFNADTGLIARREDTLSTKMTEYEERSKKLDDRYTKLELKYRLQFSALQSILSNAEATRTQLTAQFSSKNN